MKLNRLAICNVIMASALIALPSMAADVSSTTTVKTKPAVCMNGHGCSRGGFRSKAGRKEAFIKKMNISDAQLQQLATLKQGFIASIGPDKTQLKSLRTELRNDLLKPEVDKGQVVAVQNKINDVRSDLANKALNFRIEKLSVFTPEQRDQFRHMALVSEAFGGGRHHGSRRA